MASAADRLVELSRSRKYLRQRVTRISNIVEGGNVNLTPSKRQSYTEILNSIRHELPLVNREIYSITKEEDDDTDDDQAFDAEEAYEERIIYTLQCLREIENDHLPLQGNGDPHRFNKLKLPEVNLPEFSNDKNDNLERFFYSFESIIGKHSLSSYEKFVYLKGQLKKAPLTLIESLDIDDQNYPKAKELLTQAFASPLTQKFDLIKRLTELRLSNQGDPYLYIGELRNIQSAIGKLNIDIDTIVQYFAWTGLNSRFQDQLVQITNSSKPSLSQITDRFFDATERYAKINNSNKRTENNHYSFSERKSDVKTISNAINVKEKPKITCNLCLGDGKDNIDHIMKNCPIYVTPHDKYRKLKDLNFCTKCSFKNHQTKDCKFKFTSPCRMCKGNHMSFLCLKNSNRNNTDSTHNQMSITKVLRCNSNNDTVLLPSFTVDIVSDDDRTKIRVLKDSGSQRNFVLESTANKLQLPVKENNIELVIQGFNTSKNLKTKIVTVPLFINDSVCTVDAVVVPDINISINSKNLNKVTNEFNIKGYRLADSWLSESDVVDGFEMILGVESDLLLQTETEVFGVDNCKSSFLNSKLGVLLLGNINYLIDNLKYLPDISVNNITEQVVDNNEITVCMNYELTKNETDTLETADDKYLTETVNRVLNYDCLENVTESSQINDEIVKYITDNCERASDGRIIMPLPWNSESKHLLGRNFNLSKQILSSNLKKLQKTDRLEMYDKVFKEQENLGIVERIENVEDYIKDNPDCSFLPHMGVFKMSRSTTKCRIVYLSNLCEKSNSQPNAVSHNQALEAGPCLNHKLSSNIIHARFDRYLLTFDLTKAFLCIGLRECDQNKLLCLWYKSVEKGDFSLIAYKNKRLSFGLRPSPTILMLTLNRILMEDIDNDSTDIVELKRLIYNGIYMDNGCISSNDEDYLRFAYDNLNSIFEPYKFSLQQFVTNSASLQENIDITLQCETDDDTRFFGMNWQRSTDKLNPYRVQLDLNADTKRKILSSLNSIYDLFGIYTPILNRAKLFFHGIQTDTTLNWDTRIPESTRLEWSKICKQLNNTPVVSIDRCVGPRDGTYDVIAFSDASTAIYGTVVYLKDVNSGSVSFLTARNRVVNTRLRKKTVPSLEFQGITLATEVIIDLFNELTSSRNVIPITIRNLYVYTDSMVCLHWIRGFFQNYEKMSKRSVFVVNRLKTISDNCNTHPVTFKFTAGNQNPADYVTRISSYRTLMDTNYYSGPEFISGEIDVSDLDVYVNNSNLEPEQVIDKSVDSSVAAVITAVNPTEPLISHDRYSSFRKFTNVYANVLKFVDKLKSKILKNNNKNDEQNFTERATDLLIKEDQSKHFPEVVRYFSSPSKNVNKIPNLVLQLNLFMNEHGIIVVRGKFNSNYPILLHNKSILSNLIIRDIHINICHAGVYSVLNELRKTFWLLKAFSTVRKMLKSCFTCKRINGRPIKLNQNAYREFRADPVKIPFSNVFLDYIGPFKVKTDNKVNKVWLLIITCNWTRAVNLKICYSADVDEFLRNIQIHVFEYGLFRKCISDLGSQITAGTKIIANYLEEPVTRNFFESQGINSISFEQYAKGNSSLGSLVENCVKQTKNLIYKSISKNILEFKQFQLLISKVICMVNRRPIAFKDSLRASDCSTNLPSAITPESLLRGYDVTTVNIMPQTNSTSIDDVDPDYVNNAAGEIRDNYISFRKINARLCEIYHSEFLSQLMAQSIDIKDRYKPVNHKTLVVGDIVSIVEPNTKQVNYPLGIVTKIEVNSLNEVTAATVMKGNTREKTYRHVSSLIPLMRRNECNDDVSDDAQAEPEPESKTKRTRREAAQECIKKLRYCF